MDFEFDMISDKGGFSPMGLPKKRSKRSYVSLSCCEGNLQVPVVMWPSTSLL